MSFFLTTWWENWPSNKWGHDTKELTSDSRWPRDDIVMWCDGCMMCGVWCVVYDDRGRGGEELPPPQTEDCGHWAWAHVCTLPHSAVTSLPCPVGASVLSPMSASLLPWPRVSKCRCDGSLVGIFCNLINVIFLFDTCNLPWIRAVNEGSRSFSQCPEKTPPRSLLCWNTVSWQIKSKDQIDCFG